MYKASDNLPPEGKRSHYIYSVSDSTSYNKNGHSFFECKYLRLYLDKVSYMGGKGKGECLREREKGEGECLRERGQNN